MQPINNIISAFLSSTYVCRCCHSIGSCKDLSAPCNLEGKELYEDLLKITFNIEISSYHNGKTQSSKQICDNCISKLMAAFSFRNMVISSENKMAEYFKQSQKNENDVSNATFDETYIKIETSPMEEMDDRDCMENDNNNDDCNDEYVILTEMSEPEPDVDQPKKLKQYESEMKNRKSKEIKTTKVLNNTTMPRSRRKHTYDFNIPKSTLHLIRDSSDTETVAADFSPEETFVEDDKVDETIEVDQIDENEAAPSDDHNLSKRKNLAKGTSKKFKKRKLSITEDKTQNESSISTKQKVQEEFASLSSVPVEYEVPQSIQSVEPQENTESLIEPNETLKDGGLDSQIKQSGPKESSLGRRHHKKKKKNSILESSIVEEQLKLLGEAISGLSENFNSYRGLIEAKLTENDENWRQLKSISETSTLRQASVDLNDINRPPPVGYVRLDTNMIHLGQGVWLPKATYDNDIFTAGSSNMMFVKNIAVSVFGVEYLKSHSVKGKSSNKTKSIPRPAIDSRKALAIEDIYKHFLETKRNLSGEELIAKATNYEEYIRQKISDLNRGPRLAKKNEKQNAAVKKNGTPHTNKKYKNNNNPAINQGNDASLPSSTRQSNKKTPITSSATKKVALKRKSKMASSKETTSSSDSSSDSDGGSDLSIW